MDTQKYFRQSYQKKFDKLKTNVIEKPIEGWVKTIRKFFGMTTTQLAKRLCLTQSRVVRIEQNERNLKISTMEKIADALNCDFVYTFIPRENINDIIYNQAKKKALKILNDVKTNMGLENQISYNNDILEELIQDLTNGNIARIWDND